MRSPSLLVISALAAGLVVPATAQQSSTMHRYGVFFKYSDQSMKAMTETPQDRATPVAKLTEALGGKMETIYWFPMGGEFDGIIISQFPSDAAVEAQSFVVRSTGAVSRLQIVPLMGADEYKSLMERAKQGIASYTAPAAVRH